MGILSILGLTKLLNPGKPYQKGQEQLDKYYGQSQNYLQPYHQQGQEAYGHVNTAMQDLMNPSQLYDRFSNDYQMSDAAKFSQERAKQSGLNALSANGMLGSSSGLQALQAGQAQIGAEDQERHVMNMIQQYIQGAGLAQGIYGQGAQASNQLGNNAQNMGQNSAEMAYGRSAAPMNMFTNLLGMAAGLGGSYMGNQGSSGGSNGWQTGR